MRAFDGVGSEEWGDLVRGCVEGDVEGMHPLPGAAHIDHGVDAVLAESHRNRAAGSGCHGADC